MSSRGPTCVQRLFTSATFCVQVNLISPRMGGQKQATPPLSPTQASMLLQSAAAAAAARTPHYPWAQQQYQPTSPNTGLSQDAFHACCINQIFPHAHHFQQETQKYEPAHVSSIYFHATL